jgi:hypothetical protein
MVCSSEKRREENVSREGRQKGGRSEKRMEAEVRREGRKE